MATGIVRNGIYGYFTAANTSALYSDLGGSRIYYTEAPEQPGYPYCVFYIFNEIYDFTFDLEFEEVLVQFDYFGTTANECDDGLIDIKALFDYATLTVSGYTCLKMEREMVISPSKIQPMDIWSGSIRYTILIQKN